VAQTQSQTQEQRQEQRLQQSISAQQLLQAQLIELPLQQLNERIETEMNDNPALETKVHDDPQWGEPTNDDSYTDDDDFDTQREREDRNDALDAALESIGRDDEELPVYHGGFPSGEERDEYVYGASRSFYDELLEQVGELELTQQDRYIMEYLIRSLDDDGLLRTPLENICDELAIYHNIDLPQAEIERILKELQQLDPPGIGARSLQECLLLQINRRADSQLKTLMRKVISNYFDNFTKKHWLQIQQSLGIDDVLMEELMRELRRLNPKPGNAMDETMGRSLQQITPDFIVDTLDDGTISMSLNNGDLPQLQVSESFANLLKAYQDNKEAASRQMKEALLYTKQKVDAAQNFIEAIKQRQHTLTATMKAIIQQQHRFFEEGDEALLRPMILRDIAERTGLNVSTISRVTNSKYVLTRWGTFPLKFFFSDSYVTDSGEELSTREIKAALRDIISSEDKHHPLSDDALCEKLKERGYPIARRTVAKYREQLGLPVARLRKEKPKRN